MRRPEWAGTSTFAAAWHTAYKCLNHPTYGNGCAVTLHYLEKARVVVVSSEQTLALPRFDDTIEMASVLAHEPLPFEPLYIELGSIPSKLLFDEEESDTQTPLEFDISALLLTANHPKATGVGVMGFGRSVDSQGRTIVFSDGLLHAAAVDEQGEATEALYTFLPSGSSFELDNLGSAAVFGDLAARILRFLNCINVELIDAPLSRQERRATERKNNPVAQIVHIKQNQKRYEPESEEKMDWSHR